MSGLYTTHTGETIELPFRCAANTSNLEYSPRMASCDCQAESPLGELVSGESRGPFQLDGSKDNHLHRQLGGVSCTSTSPLIEIVSQEEFPQPAITLPHSALPLPASPPSSPRLKRKVRSTLVKGNFVYNEYGELVDEAILCKSQTTDELTAVQILRMIKKHFHHELRRTLGKVLVPQYDGGNSVLVDEGIWKTNRLSSWDFRPQTPKSTEKRTAEDYHSTRFHERRVLEIGCSDGSWCINFKKEYPDWVVDGVDATNHWLCDKNIADGKDYDELTWEKFPITYLNETQRTPDLSNRNINRLLQTNDHPIPHGIYEFIRAREIFDRVESYKTLLEDIRLMLQPNGVVEFIEIDPRPRKKSVGKKQVVEATKHKSVAETDRTDVMEDRFKNPFDEELAKITPGWTARVDERMKANRSPRDGHPAANLRSWLEGAGFYDVKVVVLPIHVGGDSWSGKLLRDFLKYQLELENEISKLRDELPKVDMNDIESGTYHLNLHVLTGRKPPFPRTGDLLPDGERQEMTASKYDAMARLNAAKSSQWKRFDLESKLTTMMRNLAALPGALDTITVAPGVDDSLMILRQAL